MPFELWFLMLPVTALSDYLYCPRKIYLRYVLKFVPVVREPVIKGKIKHDVFDAINKTEENLILNIKHSDIDKLDIIYKRAYEDLLEKSISKFEGDIKKAELDKEKVFNDSLRKFLDEASYRARTLLGIIKKTGLLGKDLLNALPVKHKSELFLSSSRLQIRGFIDKVEVMEDNHVPVELKTGSMPKEGVWPGHKIQLASYILLLSERFKSDHGFVEYLDHDVRRKIVMNPFLESEVRETINKVCNVLESDTIPEVCSNPNKCNSCSFKNRCFT